MNRLPELSVPQQQTLMTTTFLGYNHRAIIQDGEMYDMKNLGGDQYPLLGIRKKRAYTSFEGADALTGISGRDQLVFVRGNRVYWNFTQVAGLTVSTEAVMCPKRIVHFGAYVLIFPDKKYFNTVDLADYGTIDRLFQMSGNQISVGMCRGDGTDYDMTQITVSTTAPANPVNGKLWLDQSGDSDVLRQYTASTQEWVEVATTYVKISGIGIGHGLEMYDAVTISGLEAPDGAGTRIRAQVSALNGSYIVYFCGENYIVVSGLVSEYLSACKAQTVRVDREMPDMDWMVESNNRLWGCKYGYENGKTVNEIRASALGNFKNWYRFLGNSQDSYAASVGTDGFFTGAVRQKSYPVFFKENCIHQVYGSSPSTFQINTLMARGIQDGSGDSAVVVNEQVYYKSRTDVMMFDGSMPVSVSSQLGERLYKNARAGAVGGKYYISMQDANGLWHMMCYNTELNIWHKEDNFHALGFGRVDDELFAIDEDGNRLAALMGSQGEIEEDFDWMAEFGLFGTDFRERKYLSRFDIRMYLEEGSSARLEIKYESEGRRQSMPEILEEGSTASIENQYDSEGEWQSMPEIRGRRISSFVVPVVPRRCDHLRFRLKGHGRVRVYSISRILEVGSDG